MAGQEAYERLLAKIRAREERARQKARERANKNKGRFKNEDGTPVRGSGRSIKKDKWASWRQANRTIVKTRSKDRCEILGCANIALHWHHSFGRGNIIPEPWCSLYLLTWFLCMHHHDAIHGSTNTGLALRDWLRWKAIDQFSDFHHIDIGTEYPRESWDDSIIVIKHIVQRLELGGLTPKFKE
jgi:hypothetical protein